VQKRSLKKPDHLKEFSATIMLFLASDHAGYQLKEEIKAHLKEKGLEFEDLGTNSEESVDYPDYGFKIGEKVASNPTNQGIAVCGTGMGICMAANKIKGIRAAMVYSYETALMARQHNNANIVCFGGRTQKIEDVAQWVDAWLNEKPDPAERHHQRADKLSNKTC